jgi:hypothetical protein
MVTYDGLFLGELSENIPKLTLDDRATTTTTLILIRTESSQAPAGKFSA